ncbi:polymorphic toxin-type HINT domain-containing protein [Streptomyces sp. NPDC018833]|uniref:TreTu family toxin n=1 Tax=Streptomyces sp. NPDC018833 TaxID=3365053 RepID=UPI003794586D
MTVINKTALKTALRAPIAARRLIGLILVSTLVPVLNTGAEASANSATVRVNPSAVAQSAGAATPDPLRTGSNYPVGLNARIASFAQEVAALPRREDALTVAKEALAKRSVAFNAHADAYNKEDARCGNRITAHNTRIDSYEARVSAHNAKPNRFRLPEQAAQYNAYAAEKARLDAERARLRNESASIKAQKSKLDADKAKLEAEKSKLTADMNAHNERVNQLKSDKQQLSSRRQQLLREMASLLQSLAGTPPVAATSMARGGDAVRPPDDAGQSAAGSPADGGDGRSRTMQTASLDAYAKKHDVKVDERPVTAHLSPDAVSRLPAAEAARLNLSNTYDGLVPKPNGNYAALRIRTPGASYDPGRKAFDKAIAQGGQATATVDGERVVIDEVRPVEDTSCQEHNSFAAGTPVLLADGTVRDIEDVRVGDLLLATDPASGETSARPVTREIRGTGEKTLVDVTVTGHDTRGTVTATAGHPFWVPRLSQWTDAAALQPGQWLRTSAGTHVQISAVQHRTRSTTVHNLTVADLHTYYVLAGETPVLVRNSGGHTPGEGMVTVGRWMSSAEHQAMMDTGMVQRGGGGFTYVVYPASRDAYISARPGSVYVEFDVPKSSLIPGGRPGDFKMSDSDTIFARLAKKKGKPVPQLSEAKNIKLGGWGCS